MKACIILMLCSSVSFVLRETLAKKIPHPSVRVLSSYAFFTPRLLASTVITPLGKKNGGGRGGLLSCCCASYTSAPILWRQTGGVRRLCCCWCHLCTKGTGVYHKQFCGVGERFVGRLSGREGREGGEGMRSLGRLCRDGLLACGGTAEVKRSGQSVEHATHQRPRQKPGCRRIHMLAACELRRELALVSLGLLLTCWGGHGGVQRLEELLTRTLLQLQSQADTDTHRRTKPS